MSEYMVWDMTHHISIVRRYITVQHNNRHIGEMAMSINAHVRPTRWDMCAIYSSMLIVGN